MSFGKMIFGAIFVSALAATPAMAQRASAIGGGAQGSISSINGITQGPDGTPYYAGRSVAIDPYGARPLEEAPGPYGADAEGNSLQDDDAF